MGVADRNSYGGDYRTKFVAKCHGGNICDFKPGPHRDIEAARRLDNQRHRVRHVSLVVQPNLCTHVDARRAAGGRRRHDGCTPVGAIGPTSHSALDRI
jgi:hypothetical protein